MPVLALAFQARYRCRHSGACCASGWPIPVEAPLAVELKRSLASGELRLATAGGGGQSDPLTTPANLPDDIGALARSDATGACAFYERDGGLCAIHRQLGPHRLPSCCAHFPRVCLIDEDATYLTLSHYCPTVADMLYEGIAVERRESSVEGEPRFVEGRESSVEGEPHAAEGGRESGVLPAPALSEGLRLEGLDARGHLPPLLRPGMLADRPSYRAWERFVVEELAAGSGTAEARLARVAELTERVCAWTPSMGPSLEGHVDRCATDGIGEARGANRGDPASLYEAVRGCCPGALAPPAAPADLDAMLERWVEPQWDGWSPVVGRYLAAKVFGSWLAYQGRGLYTVLAGARAALAVLRVEAARLCLAHGHPLDAPLLKAALREADRIIVHLASREQLARRLDDLSTSRI